jgi:preprotein translocase subunit SecG
MLTTVLSWVWIGSGAVLILLVLLHSPKGDGMGGIAASGSSSFTSSSSAEATLNRITWTTAFIFLGTRCDSERWLARLNHIQPSFTNA